MIKDYKTIREVASPLMVVEQVEGVTYDELAEIELPSGELRRGKEGEISTTDSKIRIFVVCTNEELMIAKDTKEICEKL